MEPSTSPHCEQTGVGAPPWLGGLLAASFFTPCPAHAALHRSERNFFCISCGGDSLCSVCMHRNHAGSGHTVLQIRKSSYHDAVRISDVGKLLDLNGIQVYVINGAKIVFLNGRPQAKPIKGAPYHCETCQRTLLDACRFCAISCKLQALPLDPSLTLLPNAGRRSLSHADSPGLAMSDDESGDSSSRFGRSRDRGHRGPSLFAKEQVFDRAAPSTGAGQCNPNTPPRLPLLLPDQHDDVSSGDSFEDHAFHLRGDVHWLPGSSPLSPHASPSRRDGYGFGKVKRRRGVEGEEVSSAWPGLEDEVAPASPLLASQGSTWRTHKRKGVPHRSPLA